MPYPSTSEGAYYHEVDQAHAFDTAIDQLVEAPIVLVEQAPHMVAGALANVPSEHRAALCKLLMPAFGFVPAPQYAALREWFIDEEAGQVAIDLMNDRNSSPRRPARFPS